MEVRAQQIRKEYIRTSRDTNILTAVASCDFLIPAGQVTVIHGSSGSGKSTLLNVLAGILHPTEGKVFYDGMDLYAKRDEKLSGFRNLHIGYVPQGRSAVSSLNVLENVKLPYALYEEDGSSAALEMTERFGIRDLCEVMPDCLSGGELRRMAIARALVRKPEVIFADEPTGDLDDENTKTVLDSLRQLAKEGAAVLIVTHEEEAFTYADRIFSMNAGKLSQESCRPG